MIYRIFLELFKSESPLRECSQDHETEHRSVSPISVKDPSSSPPTLEWLISCMRLPLVNFELYRDIRSPPLQLISSICFLLFHKTERTPFIPNPIRPPLLFPLPLLCIREPCSLSPLFLSRVAILLIWVWKLVWNLNYILILLPLPLFCSDVNYVWLSLINELFYDMLISSLPFSTTKFRSWHESESHPALNPTLFRRLWATFGWGYNAMPKPNFVLTLLRSKFGINHSFLVYSLHSKE